MSDCGARSGLSSSEPSDSLSSPSQSIVSRPSARNSKSNTTPCTDSRVRKRNLNTLAARRYRQKRTDEQNNLAAELKEAQAERDDLKVHVARLEGELEGLKRMLHMQGPDQQ